MLIKDLHRTDKPREKMKTHGPDAMSDSELLAIIFRTGARGTSVLELATKVLSNYHGLQGLLNIRVEELMIFEGLGTAKACSLVAVVELSKRLLHPNQTAGIKIRSPKDVFNLIGKELCYELSEKLLLVSIDSRGKFIASDTISTGTVNETIINPREIFQRALSRNASSIILAHNHPSGEPDPSPEDLEATKTVQETGKKLGIPLLDHIVITKTGFLSLKQTGQMTIETKGGDINGKK